MDTTQLTYFKTIAECGSLTKAAEKLHISQPAMSAMLKKFEEEIGVELFDRTPNRIHLNSSGETALIYVNSILRNIEQMKSDLRNHAEQNQTISMAFCDPGIQWYCIPAFPSACPEIKVSSFMYQNEDEINLLQSGSYDVLLTSDKLEYADIESLPFLFDQVYLSVSAASPLAEQKTISLRDIEPQPLLISDMGGYFTNQLEMIIREENPKVTLTKNEFMVTQQLIRNTDILATSSILAQPLRNDGSHRVLIPLSDPEQRVTYHISFLKKNRKKIRAFLSWAESQKKESIKTNFS